VLIPKQAYVPAMSRQGGQIPADPPARRRAGNYSIKSVYLCALGALKIFTACPPYGRQVCVHPWPRPGMQCLGYIVWVNRYHRACNICQGSRARAGCVQKV